MFSLLKTHRMSKKREKRDERGLHYWQLWFQLQQNITFGNQHVLVLSLAASQLTRKSHCSGQVGKRRGWCAFSPRPQLEPHTAQQDAHLRGVPRGFRKVNYLWKEVHRHKRSHFPCLCHHHHHHHHNCKNSNIMLVTSPKKQTSFLKGRRVNSRRAQHQSWMLRIDTPLQIKTTRNHSAHTCVTCTFHVPHWVFILTVQCKQVNSTAANRCSFPGWAHSTHAQHRFKVFSLSYRIL